MPHVTTGAGITAAVSSPTDDGARPRPAPSPLTARRADPDGSTTAQAPPARVQGATGPGWPTWGALALTPVPLCPDEDTDDTEPLPDPRAWVEAFVRLACEVGSGQRPVSQVQRWAAPDVLATLARRHALATRLAQATGRARTATVVRAVVVCAVTARVHEASCVVVDRGRVRAVAVRVEAAGGRHRATSLEIG